MNENERIHTAGHARQLGLTKSYECIRVYTEGNVCRVQMYRPEANNAINTQMLRELYEIVTLTERAGLPLLVLEGLPEVFCFGADFNELSQRHAQVPESAHNPAYIYELWKKMSTSAVITLSHVRGKVNAGGVGFVAASDIVVADEKAVFSLSELLFGLLPACVMPFLVRRVGYQRAKYMTLSTQAIDAQTASAWGLVDECSANSEAVLRRLMLRLQRVSAKSSARCKRFVNDLPADLCQAEPTAVAMNREVFNDADNLAAIERYVREGLFPWE